jgi:GYF domain 2
MKYYIQRQLNEYGPYTLADLQRYVAQGSILLTDLTRSEGMTDWVPVSQVIGNIPVPVPAAAVPGANPAYGGGTVFAGGGTGYPGAATVYGGAAAVPAVSTGPMPPDFHWALVLLIGFFCGLFQLVWLFVEAGFVKKLDRESNFMGFLIGGIATEVVAFIIIFASAGAAVDRDPSFVVFPFFIVLLAGVVLQYVGLFKMRSAIENYYNTVEPINLRLSGVMTFFFAVYYFQYHFSRIANWKKTGYLQPQ